MRRLAFSLGAALALGATPVTAQVAAGAPAANASAGSGATAAPDSARSLAGAGLGDWFTMPGVAPTHGARTIASGDTVHGDVATEGGTLRVEGVVTGHAVAWGGDVVVGPGGVVQGDAIAVQGRVRLNGGRVDGELRSVRGDVTSAPLAAAPERAASLWEQVQLVLGWLVVALLIGIGVLVFAGGPLQATVEMLQGAFGRSLLAGIAGQLAIAPVILLVVVGLAITILGILLIPFAVVAVVLAAAGLMTLGFLAAAQVTGTAMQRGDARRLSARGATLRALMLGIVLYLLPWLVAALLAQWPLAQSVARGVAVAIAWATVTAGFGAALLSRAGTRRLATPTLTATVPQPTAPQEISWQTPTPIGGVAAARRPTESSPAGRSAP